jgi:replicative superfamily II helicase
MIIRWLHVASRQMVEGAFWRIARSVNSRVSRYIEHTARFANMFEMLPPQRAAILEEGLLDPAKRSVVVNLPTSAGKTALAVFRILQALNQFSQDGGWVAYTAPTRALVSQLTRRLRKDLGPIGIRVEQLSGAVEIDSFEEGFLEAGSDGAKLGKDKLPFDVLVTTPEKLDLVIRNGRVKRPLALIVVDEAHNIQESNRGLKLELLLATIKRDCERASFLLLTPHIPNGSEIADWLAPGQGSSKSISLGVGPWQPNERVVGAFYTERGSRPREWNLKFRTLQTTPGTIHLSGKDFTVGLPGPVDEVFSKVSNTLSLQAAAMAKVFSEREGSLSLAITANINDVWSMARRLNEEMPLLPEVPESIRLVQRFLRAEISPEFELIGMLERGIAVHHAGLSDETRSLVERLAEDNHLRVICATTTIAQGIDFRISSVFLASTTYPYGQPISSSDFWNLAGRTGRVLQESVGIVGIAARGNEAGSHAAIEAFVSSQTVALVSTLVGLVEEAFRAGNKLSLESVLHLPQWQAFWGYLAHIYNQTRSSEAMAAQAEQVLRNTLGYRFLERESREKARALLEVTKEYGRRLSQNSQLATLADATGFSPESLRSAIGSLRGKVEKSDWKPEGLFGGNRNAFQNLMGIMLNLPETKQQLKEITSKGMNERQLANLTADWVNGKSIEELARQYFAGPNVSDAELTEALSKACRSIYGKLTIAATWGVSALSKLPTSGINFETLSERDRWLLNCLPAMIYYGVPTEEAALMRMHGVPRRIAKPIGDMFKRQERQITKESSVRAAEFLRGLTLNDWEQVVPKKIGITGKDYHQIWQLLTGNTEETKPPSVSKVIANEDELTR